MFCSLMVNILLTMTVSSTPPTQSVLLKKLNNKHAYARSGFSAQENTPTVLLWSGHSSCTGNVEVIWIFRLVTPDEQFAHSKPN